jgi:hypothetical protein
MYLTRGGSVQRPLTSGPRGWPAGQIPWLARHEKGKAKAVKKSVEAEPHGRAATWLGRPATTW